MLDTEKPSSHRERNHRVTQIETIELHREKPSSHTERETIESHREKPSSHTERNHRVTPVERNHRVTQRETIESENYSDQTQLIKLKRPTWNSSLRMPSGKFSYHYVFVSHSDGHMLYCTHKLKCNEAAGTIGFWPFQYRFRPFLHRFWRLAPTQRGHIKAATVFTLSI